MLSSSVDLEMNRGVHWVRCALGEADGLERGAALGLARDCEVFGSPDAVGDPMGLVLGDTLDGALATKDKQLLQ